jgi:signal transduction histidine kinase
MSKTLLEAKNAAEALSKSKMDFLANMSHEIRTPMNAIIGLAQLGVLAEPYKQREYLSKILGASENLLVIVNDILEFSKIEAEGIQLVKEYFSLGRLVENLSNIFEESARQKVLQFKLNLSSDVTRHLIGDEVRLQQVLINLLNNSLKFTHEGSVSLDVTLVSKDDHSITLRFAINDTGIGISQEQQRSLFKAFQQADSSISRRFGGTGLGLAISQQLVGLMGGEIHCESAEGKGSCFWFELTFDLPSVQAVEAFKQHAYRNRPLQEQLKDYTEKLAGVTVLLVEDLPLNQQVASEFLQNTGLLVTIANHGEESTKMA